MPDQDDPSVSPADEVAHEKWRLLPMFFKVRGVLKQHIESYNYLVQHDLLAIVKSQVNCEVRSEVNPNFFLRYEHIYVGKPGIKNDTMNASLTPVTPQECRLRNLTYSAPILVDIKYSKILNKRMVTYSKKRVTIGKIPVMLRSSRCVLTGKNEAQLAALQECPHDPGGYFVVRGSEKVLLIQEQQSKNRILLQVDANNNAFADVQSSTHEAKSRTYVVIKKGRLYMRHNSFTEDIPIIVALKAMNMQSDVLIYNFIGFQSSEEEPFVEPGSQDKETARNRDRLQYLVSSFEECFRLGVVTNLQALEYISSRVRRFTVSKIYEKFLSPNADPMTRNYGTKQRLIEDTRDVLADYVLSHIKVKHGTCYDFRPKTNFLALMVRECLRAQLDRSILDDKDYYGNKRLELAGQLLSVLFEDLFKRFNSELKRETDKVLNRPKQAETFDMYSKIRSYHLITTGFVNAIASGNWILKRFKMERHGVSQQLSRLSYLATLGQMTRLTSNFEKTRKVSGPRALQPSQWGTICVADTPEGESCGLVKNLALLCHVTSEGDAKAIERICYTLGVERMELNSGEEVFHMNRLPRRTEKTRQKGTKHGSKKPTDIYVEDVPEGPFLIILNGLLLGTHSNPVRFARQLRKLRRMRKLNEFVSIFVNPMKRMILITSDGGRVCRPLIIVNQQSKSGKIKKAHLQRLSRAFAADKAGSTKEVENMFDFFLKRGFIEYIDVNETNNTLVALKEADITPETTHLEIDPLSILGLVAGLIPYPNHNQSPRNTYQCAMGKQSMGFLAYNQFKRFDTLLYSMIYSQKPLVKSRTLDLVNFDKLSAGHNAVIAVMSFTGYDIEDAIVLNKASLDRGFGRCMAFRSFETVKRKYPTGSDLFMKPAAQKDRKGKPGEDAIDVDGIIRIGAKIKPGYKLVNKMVPLSADSIAQLSEGTLAALQGKRQFQSYKPSPLKYIGPKKASVDKVMLTSSERDSYICKVLTRDVRRPEIGDKFSSRHGQKGVCGLIVGQEDMPFTDTGICPDLIMNPHGFPSRMTVGKMLELIAGKAAVNDGKFKYGTAFHGDRLDDMQEILISHGFSFTGKDVLTSGTSGETLEAYIFMGPVYYQKLKHMVVDKMHARQRGPKALLTRQPTEGRSRGGGLRVGEMERDCLVAYGASALLVERLMLSSDLFEATFCTKCGKLAQQHICQLCQSKERLTTIKMPYACKLLFQELEAMNIVPRVKFSI